MPIGISSGTYAPVAGPTPEELAAEKARQEQLALGQQYRDQQNASLPAYTGSVSVGGGVPSSAYGVYSPASIAAATNQANGNIPGSRGASGYATAADYNKAQASGITGQYNFSNGVPTYDSTGGGSLGVPTAPTSLPNLYSGNDQAFHNGSLTGTSGMYNNAVTAPASMPTVTYNPSSPIPPQLSGGPAGSNPPGSAPVNAGLQQAQNNRSTVGLPGHTTNPYGIVTNSRKTIPGYQYTPPAVAAPAPISHLYPGIPMTRTRNA